MSDIDRDCRRILCASASACALSLSVTVTRCRPWASSLFAGHRFTLDVASDDDVRLDGWLVALPEVELDWPGHFVASAEVIDRRADAATIELLVVES